MNTTLNKVLPVAASALILMTGCVSMKKYKTSQAELAKARSDSAQLAQQVASLNGNVQSLTDRNSAYQRSLDSSTSRYSEQQKSLDYYHGYYKAQQDTLAQVNQDVQTALTQAGVTNGDVSESENVIYVRLDENDVFSKNSTRVTPMGQKVLDGIAQAAMNHPDVDVAVAAGDSATGWVDAKNMHDNSGMNAEPMHHRTHVHHTAPMSSGGAGSGGSANGGGSSAANSSSATVANNAANMAPEHKKVHHHYSSEEGMAFNTTRGHHPGWALKQGRMVAVANHFIQNGMPKVNVTVQRPPMNGEPGKAIKIILRPATHHLNPQNAAAMGGTEKQ